MPILTIPWYYNCWSATSSADRQLLFIVGLSTAIHFILHTNSEIYWLLLPFPIKPLALIYLGSRSTYGGINTKNTPSTRRPSSSIALTEPKIHCQQYPRTTSGLQRSPPALCDSAFEFRSSPCTMICEDELWRAERQCQGRQNQRRRLSRHPEPTRAQTRETLPEMRLTMRERRI